MVVISWPLEEEGRGGERWGWSREVEESRLPPNQHFAINLGVSTTHNSCHHAGLGVPSKGVYTERGINT